MDPYEERMRKIVEAAREADQRGHDTSLYSELMRQERERHEMLQRQLPPTYIGGAAGGGHGGSGLYGSGMGVYGGGIAGAPSHLGQTPAPPQPWIIEERIPSPYAAKQPYEPEAWSNALRENRSGMIKIPLNTSGVSAAASIQFVLSHFLISETKQATASEIYYIVAHPSLPSVGLGENMPILQITLYNDGGISIRSTR